MAADRDEILAAGRAEASRMKAAVAQAPAGVNVTIDARQFGKLADLMMSLCDMARERIDEGFENPRYWVPLGEYVKLRERLPHGRGARSAEWSLDHALRDAPSDFRLS